MEKVPALRRGRGIYLDVVRERPRPEAAEVFRADPLREPAALPVAAALFAERPRLPAALSFGDEGPALFADDFFAVVLFPEEAFVPLAARLDRADGFADAGTAVERARGFAADALLDDVVLFADGEDDFFADAPLFAAVFFGEDALFAAGALFAADVFSDDVGFLAGFLAADVLFAPGALFRLPFFAAVLPPGGLPGDAARSDGVLRDDFSEEAAVLFFRDGLLCADEDDDRAEVDRPRVEPTADRLFDEPAEELLRRLRVSPSSPASPTFSATVFTASLITCVTLSATSLTVSVTLSSTRDTGDAADRLFLAAIILSSTCNSFYVLSAHQTIPDTTMNASHCIDFDLRQERCRFAYH